MTSIAAAPWILVAMAVAAAYCIVGLQTKSGWFDVIDAWGAAHPTRFPGTGLDGTLRTTYLGVPAVDHHIAGGMRVFAAMANGHHQPLSLFSFWFAGQLLAVHTLQVLEGLRAGNRGRLISYTAFWGALYQTMTFGITTPIWAALWFWTSPIASVTAADSDATLTAALAIEDTDLSVLPHSLIWGYLLPTMLCCLPSPAFVPFDQKVTFILVWQFFPIITSVSHRLFSAASRRLRPAAATTAAPEQKKAELARRLRWVYIFTLTLVVANHAATLAYVLLPSLRPPSLAPPNPADVDVASVFGPASTPLKLTPVASIEDGALNLLQYDGYFGAAAVLYWASIQFWAASDAPSLATVLTGLAGPAGAAMVLVWRRDERLLLASVPKAKTT
ncbi:hypothetical protein GGTG_10543 [Gaeumannomyces tritici R3-111a-1]|uniref:Uncharacterized protein n=1 Tax=Gaeumannomyces tritici (strain R3-111a-1) TaxID=644352 RepID=J3PAL8_GAET3|nr:hypothetical protein GGTG_10543 [Gaeumannomyces tritici R3-111a-1]EJT71284.1 hypothetical protein GGTG_10543 [Gaeumannomyces tritici R3-111a-1]